MNPLDTAKQALQEQMDRASAELRRLEEAMRVLSDEPASSTSGSTTPRRTTQRASTQQRKPATRRRTASRSASSGSRRGGKTRIDQAADVLRENPGIRAKDLAEAMKITPANATQLLSRMREREMARSDSGKYYLVEAAASQTSESSES